MGTEEEAHFMSKGNDDVPSQLSTVFLPFLPLPLQVVLCRLSLRGRPLGSWPQAADGLHYNSEHDLTGLGY